MMQQELPVVTAFYCTESTLAAESEWVTHAKVESSLSLKMRGGEAIVLVGQSNQLQ